ncbi:MAG: hypothetical protein HFACDABA_02781 [Anaerolineales bacterium]|nr:hypothetical protein [Anaerolineales bacterium]
MFEGDDQTPFEEEQPAEESSNRNFFIIAGILVGIVCLSVAGLGFYALRVLPQQSNARIAQEATLVAQDVQVGQTLTQIALFDALSQTPQATATLPPTNTPPIQQASGTAPVSAPADPQTATVAAALTQAAQAQLTVTFLPTSTAVMPTSGFADEAGLPGLVVMTIALVAVILLARKLRSAPTAK